MSTMIRHAVCRAPIGCLTGHDGAGWIREDFGGYRGWTFENLGNLDAPSHIAAGGMTARNYPRSPAQQLAIKREGKQS